MNDSGEGTKGLDLGEEDGSPLMVPIDQSLAAMTCSKVQPRLGWIVLHPTVSPSVSLVMRDGLALPIITSRGQWFGQGMCL